MKPILAESGYNAPEPYFKICVAGGAYTYTSLARPRGGLKKKIDRARSARLQFHRVGSARRADKREFTAQTRVADLG
jgi:hypothetical protein